MKVLIVSEYWVPREMGGGEVSADLLAQGLVAQGVTVTVLTSRVDTLPAVSVERGMTIHRTIATGKHPATLSSNIKRALVFPWSLRRAIRRLLAHETFDIIHVMGMTAIPVVAEIRTNIPKTAHINSAIPFCPKSTLLRSTARGESTCDLVRCTPRAFVSCLWHTRELGKMPMRRLVRWNPFAYLALYRRYLRLGREQVLRAYAHYFPISSFLGSRLDDRGVAKTAITRVLNPVILDDYVRIPLMKRAKPRLYYIGNYVASKGLLVLLDAVKQLHGEFELHLYGSGPLEAELRERVATEHLPVTIHGRVAPQELPKVHEENDICILPSLVLEGLGRLLIEAMAAGKAVVGADSGGIRDVFVHEESGMLVPPGDVNALATVLQQLVDKPMVRLKLGAKARERAVKVFDQRLLATQMHNVWKGILSTRELPAKEQGL